MSKQELELGTNANEEIIDIQIEGIKKKKFRINGEDNKILELNVSDMSISKRLSETYPKLMKIVDELSAIKDDDKNFSEGFSKADNQMRELVDYVFQSNVSELCADSGTMYDPVSGMFRFEHIIDTLSKLYENNFNAEFKKMRSRIQKHTEKYGKK